MLEIRDVEVHGLERSLKASGNPMKLGQPGTMISVLTMTDLDRGKRLGRAERGSGHDNFLSGIVVWFDVKYPLYWSPEFQRYHFAQIISSQSTMHRLTTACKGDDFNDMFNQYVDPEIIEKVNRYIDDYNALNEWSVSDEDCKYYHPDSVVRYDSDEFEQVKYKAFMKARSNLPSGYEMWMSCVTNYLQLKTIYAQRKGHKLREDWGAFCKMCEELPMFLELTQKEKK